jgi:hypothetical protein
MVEQLKAFAKTQATSTLIDSILQIEKMTKTKKINGIEFKDYSDDLRISRVAMLDVIEDREGVEFMDSLLEKIEA